MHVYLPLQQIGHVNLYQKLYANDPTEAKRSFQIDAEVKSLHANFNFTPSTTRPNIKVSLGVKRQQLAGSVSFEKTEEKVQIGKNTTRVVYLGPRNVKYVKMQGHYQKLTS
jgi:hypothetical protein